MKHLKLFFLLSIFFISCQPKPGENAETRLRGEIFSLKRENDSLKRIIKNLSPSAIPDTISKLDTTSTSTVNSQSPEITH